jgi:hypothetical protein
MSDTGFLDGCCDDTVVGGIAEEPLLKLLPPEVGALAPPPPPVPATELPLEVVGFDMGICLMSSSNSGTPTRSDVKRRMVSRPAALEVTAAGGGAKMLLMISSSCSS